MAVAMGGLTVSAQATLAKGEMGAEGRYLLSCGHVEMEIDAAKGGKILSLKYDDREMLSQLRWPESFGSTFWTSPQKEWNWPPVKEFDKMPYMVEQEVGTLSMTSEVSERLKCRVGKTFTADEKDGAIVVTYTITNEGSEPRKVAPWEITRVENEGGGAAYRRGRRESQAGARRHDLQHGALDGLAGTDDQRARGCGHPYRCHCPQPVRH